MAKRQRDCRGGYDSAACNKDRTQAVDKIANCALPHVLRVAVPALASHQRQHRAWVAQRCVHMRPLSCWHTYPLLAKGSCGSGLLVVCGHGGRVRLPRVFFWGESSDGRAAVQAPVARRCAALTDGTALTYRTLERSRAARSPAPATGAASAERLQPRQPFVHLRPASANRRQRRQDRRLCRQSGCLRLSSCATQLLWDA